MRRSDFILVGLGFAVLMAGCAKKEEKEAEPVLPVEVAEARRGPIDRVIDADGILRACDQSAITPKISAPVKKFFVNRGDHVQKGQLLATLENRDLEAAVADAKAALEQASASYRNVSAATVPDEVVKAQTDVQAAKQTVEAAQKLLQSREQLFKEGALARRMVDEATVSYVQAKSQYESAQKHLESLHTVGRHEEVKGAAAQVESAKAKYEAAQAQLSYSEIRSPISGVVADRPAFAGEMASAGTALITVMDVSSVIARVNLPVSLAANVKVGQGARIAATDTGLEAQGRVTVVSPAVDPQSTTVEVWVQAVNPREQLHPGGTVHVTIKAGTVPDAVIVPAAAILPAQAGGSAVMVVGADSVAHERKVDAGVRGAETVQLVTGVAAGEKIVVSGGVGLQDGAKVRVDKPGEGKPHE